MDSPAYFPHIHKKWCETKLGVHLKAIFQTFCTVDDGID